MTLTEHRELSAFAHNELLTLAFRPEGVPRMYDLIRVEDERVLPAFYYALRDTLVADDIDAATRISNM